MAERDELRERVASIPELLREAESRFRALLQNSDEMLTIFRPSGRVLYASPATLQLLGYREEEFIGHHAFEFVHPDDQAVAQRLFEQLGISKSAVTEEARIRHRDGSWRILRGTFQNHVDDPAVGGIVVNYRDVTSIRATERALRALEDHAAFALDAAKAGIWEVDLRTERITHSATMGAILGFSANEFDGSREAFRRLIHPDDVANVDAAIGRSVETDAPYRVEYRAIWPDGTIRWIEAVGRVERDPSGQPVKMLGIALDVTARKALEAQLQQSQKMEALGLLAGGVAHDFNNLLAVILGFTDLMLATFNTEDPRASDLVEIKRASDQARQLITQLLAFSRRQPAKPAPVNLNEILADAEGILRQVVGKRVRLRLAPTPQVGLIWADPGQLHQVLVNLAVNARDAMPEGGELLIETTCIPASSEVSSNKGLHHEAVALIVRDTGVGMTPETQARIFEPFFTTKEPEKGTGLGLSTVYGIVNQSNGHISVSSRVGHGTTFAITFPVVEV